jgi:16S rRNA (uracil1498-N3)-methyltransferase
MNLFYCPDIHSSDILLSPGESAHCVRVLRLGKGEKVQVMDGKGGLFEAVIANPDARQCHLEITGSAILPPARNFNLHIVIAPTRSIDRFEWFIEKSVEIGIDTITPLLCQRSERRVLKTDRLQKLIIATMKQAQVLYLPLLNELTDLGEFIRNYSGPRENRFIAHCGDTPRQKLQEAIQAGKDSVVMIGPEGDFTPEEVELAINKGFTPVSLGQNRLRTETAGVVVCNSLILLNELIQA